MRRKSITRGAHPWGTNGRRASHDVELGVEKRVFPEAELTESLREQEPIITLIGLTPRAALMVEQGRVRRVDVTVTEAERFEAKVAITNHQQVSLIVSADLVKQRTFEQ